MLIIVGKTASGKDTVVNKLVKENGFKKLVTYTTRPPRKYEKDGVTYHFISEKEFKDKIYTGFFAEWRSYKSINGEWFYGSAKEDYMKSDNKTVVILNPDGFYSVRELFKDAKSVYLYANEHTIAERLTKRGDSTEEAKRRMKADREDFSDMLYETGRIIYNNSGTDINSVIQKIIKFAEEK